MKLHVKIDDQDFEVEVEDINARPIKAVVDGEVYEVYPEETAATVVPAPTVTAVASRPAAPATPRPAPVVSAAPAPAGANSVTAPLPGVITAIKVKEGDTVKQGQEIIGLEAMKMNNAIRASRPGKVVAIHVTVGDHVKHGQVLVDLGD